jgi:type II restriction enzyme
MNAKDLVALYEKWKTVSGEETFRHISAILTEAKKIHYQDWLKHPTPNNDHEQSWRGFKGKNLEKLIEYIIKDEVESLGLGIVNGNKLERTKASNLPLILNKVWQNLQVKYVVDGSSIGHLPDIDLIIYRPNTAAVLAVLSSKVTLRERIAQTGYWKIKLSQSNATKDIRVFFVTPDEDGTLTKKFPMKKGRAIVEVDTHGAYVMTEATIETSNRVKTFDQFIVDLKELILSQ